MELTAERIIREAIEEDYEDRKQEKYDWIDRLFDFRRPSESKQKSQIITILTRKLMDATQSQHHAEIRAEETRKIAYDCVKIYGGEATTLFEDMWKRLKNKYPSLS